MQPVQGAPQRELAVNPEHQSLELDHPAQGRVADQPTVELESADLLRAPPAEHLQAVDSNLELTHDLEQDLAILLDLTCELLEKRPIGRATVAAGRPPSQLA